MMLRKKVRDGTISIGGSDSSDAVRKALTHGSNLYFSEEDLLHDPRIAHRTEDMLRLTLASRGSRERNLLALPTLNMYLPLSKFESIHRMYNHYGVNTIYYYKTLS